MFCSPLKKEVWYSISKVLREIDALYCMVFNIINHVLAKSLNLYCANWKNSSLIF